MIMKTLLNIEDCLEAAAGLEQMHLITIDNSDKTIMHSIARQVFKGTALTDKQFALMQEKLKKYKDQFDNLDCDFDFIITQLRQPLRQIDRSKYIKVVDDEIVVRFPFKKSLIICINTISNRANLYRHDKGSHKHYFSLTDRNIDLVLEQFIDKNFEIDETLTTRYKDIQVIKENRLDYLPHFDGQDLLNCSPKMISNVQDEIGEISSNNFLKIADRRLRHGYYMNVPQPITLTDNIAFRRQKLFHNEPKKNNLDKILTSLYQLDRFPLVVMLEDTHALDQLYKIQNVFRDLIPASEQSVLFRQEGKTDFNEYIQEKKLNNWVDKNTKIVYINTMKVPKILITHDEWHPISSFSFSSTLTKEVNTYIEHFADLIVFHEDMISPFRLRGYSYGR